MIELKDIAKTYHMGDHPVLALRGVSLTIEPGEFVAIMGPSGSGKSTLMHVLGLLDVPDSGSYRLFGKEVAGLSEDELAGLRSRVIGFVFQQFHLLARTPADENVALPLLYSGQSGQTDRAARLLERVGLGSRLHHKPNELSGGQQQRVAIARAMVNEPRILFADEPTGNLDSTSEKEIMELLHSLNAQGITVILVTHEPEIARYAKRVIRMRDGRVQSDERRESPPVSALAAEPAEKPRAPGWTAISEHFRQGVRALLANKVRSGLSMLGILIGVAAVIAMLALGNGARRSIEAQLASMGSNLLVLRTGGRRGPGAASQEAGSTARLTLDDMRALRESVPDIRRLSASVNGRVQAVFGNKNWNTQLLGTTPSYPEMRAAKPDVGRFFTEEEVQRRMRVAVVGMTVVRELFGENNPLGEHIKVNRINFQVIGVLPEKGSASGGFRDQDDVILVPLSTAMYRVLGKDHLDSLDIEIRDGERIDAAEEHIVEVMNKRHRVPAAQSTTAFQVRNMAEIQEAISESGRVMAWLLASIAAISLLVGGIGIMNIMLVSVSERTREIGLRKAVGATRFDILSQFLIEAVVISVMGGSAGIALGWFVTLLMSSLAGWEASVSLWSVTLAFVFSAGIGILFGIWPAKKASLLSPIVALRYE